MTDKELEAELLEPTMEMLQTMEVAPILDGWVSSEHIAEKLSEYVRASYSMWFLQRVKVVLYRLSLMGRLERRGAKIGAKIGLLDSRLYRLPNVLDRFTAEVFKGKNRPCKRKK